MLEEDMAKTQVVKLDVKVCFLKDNRCTPKCVAYVRSEDVSKFPDENCTLLNDIGETTEALSQIRDHLETK
jgi:hypothetical protein